MLMMQLQQVSQTITIPKDPKEVIHVLNLFDDSIDGGVSKSKNYNLTVLK